MRTIERGGMGAAWIAAVILIASAAAPARAQEPAEGAAPLVSAAELKAWLSFLASDAMGGRRTGSPEIKWAGEWLAARFVEQGLEAPPGLPDHFQPFTVSGRRGGGPVEGFNVIAWRPGSDPARRERYLMLTAHYDHNGRREPREPGGDGIMNGADDDGSGTIVMLGIAAAIERMIGADASLAPKRSIVFIAWSGEEMGMRGSRHYAGDPVWPLENMIVNFNFEMLGHTENLGRDQIWLTGGAYSNLLDLIAAEWRPDGWTVIDCPLPGRDLFLASDNASFARLTTDEATGIKYGIPAHSISTWGNESHYHQPNDEVDIIDFENMERIVNRMARTVLDLANSEATIEWKEDSGFARYTGGR